MSLTDSLTAMKNELKSDYFRIEIYKATENQLHI
ncbi:hypothetical protein MBMB1_0361 [Methanobacterium sp. MB1]|nr:hypothetical protein MBMB1_0361 [Methanobacterium sp. MB1]